MSIPLGAQFKSYELNAAINYYLLDPFQYAITKFDYTNPNVVPGALDEKSAGVLPKRNMDPNGLIYTGVNFEELLPAYTATKKSENDYSAADYHRFLANNGYFNPNEGNNNTDLWYYGADKLAEQRGYAGAPLNVQEVNHIIFPEAQRGGLNSTNVAKYSWENTSKFVDKTSWQSQNQGSINNDENCQFFNYNNTYSTTNTTRVPFNKVYTFDSNYVRNIGISGPTSGSMPFVN